LVGCQIDQGFGIGGFKGGGHGCVTDKKRWGPSGPTTIDQSIHGFNTTHSKKQDTILQNI
jgi:hypothetical protein